MVVNVIVLFAKIEEGRSIRNLLVKNGIDVTKVCTTGAQAAQFADACDDGLIICGYKYNDMLYTDLANYLTDCFEMIVVASRSNYHECQENGIICLSMPLKAQDFVHTVSLAIDNILWNRKRRKDVPKERTEEEKKVISMAKKKLMSEYNFGEGEAHHYLQKKSMDSGRNIVEIAYMVLDNIIV